MFEVFETKDRKMKSVAPVYYVYVFTFAKSLIDLYEEERIYIKATGKVDLPQDLIVRPNRPNPKTAANLSNLILCLTPGSQ